MRLFVSCILLLSTVYAQVATLRSSFIEDKGLFEARYPNKNQPSDLSILWWNIQNGGTKPTTIKSNLVQFIESYPKPDLVVLGEALENDLFQNLKRVLAIKNYQTKFFKYQNGSAMGYALFFQKHLTIASKAYIYLGYLQIKKKKTYFERFGVNTVDSLELIQTKCLPTGTGTTLYYLL